MSATEVKATTTTAGNRIVLVTGANQGIGLEAVKQLMLLNSNV
jgi:NAD(P)-dependent dehydrogenase (short-subunit alcohol dehydrogenase family)